MMLPSGLLILALASTWAQVEAVPGEVLEALLRREDPASLARDARTSGDAGRGALIFHRPSLTCTKCHLGGEGKPPLGPDLAEQGRGSRDVDLVESVLEPSRAIRKGYETVTVSIEDGRTIAGLLAKDTEDGLVLRDPAQDGKLVSIPRASIEERKDVGISLMPSGLAANLGSRQEFLDLVRYLIEIAEKGTTRARELSRGLVAEASRPLPDADRDIDHAGLIAGLGRENLERGRKIYERVCINCHGTRDLIGSLPTSLRFASGSFKNGADPFSIYRTLSLGFGQMTAQGWMVPRQKYDVIHYIRETFLKPYNPGQYVGIGPAYLANLPRGNGRGPDPVDLEPWSTMDYGPSLIATGEVSGGDGSNIVDKGIMVRLDPGAGGVARGRAWAVYDEDTLRFAAGWTGAGFLDWNGINFNGRHQVHPRLAGKVEVANPDRPGWSNPFNGTSVGDLDLRARDINGDLYGPLPRRWLHYKGLYHHGDRVILSYTVGQAEVLESPGLETKPRQPGRAAFTRTLEIGKSPHDLRMLVAPEGVATALAGDGPSGTRLIHRGGYTLLNVPAGATPLLVKVLIDAGHPGWVHSYAKQSPPAAPLRPLTNGGPGRWPEILTTRATIGEDDGPFAVDHLTVPERNPWLCLMRLSGFDFLPGGRRLAACTWDGDVWLVDGIGQPEKGLAWRRIASGLFQPLGLKVVEGVIHVTCRDQIARLHDLNGDGEVDYYENFNNDHQVTEHFHEFAMDLQTDPEGNFYYTKAARHGLTALVPQHGTLLKVSKDGLRTEILATGFRAPNGVCINPDGTFFVSDQEGFWLPKNRINLVKRGGFYGNLWGYTKVTDPSDSTMAPPVCWITNAFDRSPAQLLRVDSRDEAWRPLRGSLLCLSYGYGKIFVVPHETVAGVMQGGECELPIRRFPTGVMRGRFHPGNGQLYACGLFAWAGDQAQPGGLYRVRATGKPMQLPIGLHARDGAMVLAFTDPLDPRSATDPASYRVKVWSIKRSAEYGSKHYGERALRVEAASLSADGREVTLKLPDLRPTWCMEIGCKVRSRDGTPIEKVIHNTVHHLGGPRVSED